MATDWPDKDPDDVLDYTADFSDYMDGTEVFTGSPTVTAESGITVNSSAFDATNTKIVAWLSGGTDGKRYLVRCKGTTDNGVARTIERTMRIAVRSDVG